MVSIGSAGTAVSTEIEVLTAGAYKQVVLALLPAFEKQTGHKLIVNNGTVGGLVTEYIAKGEAEIGIHQIGKILPVKGETLVGPLSADIQNYTTYAAGLGAGTKACEPATALIKALSGPLAEPVLKSKGMAPAS